MKGPQWAPLLNQVTALVQEAAALCTRPNTITAKGEQDFVTEVDTRISDYMMEALPRLLPGSRVLSEEAPPPPHLEQGPLWVVDPIDGTTNYIFGLPLFCISLGLLWEGQPVLGVVYNPAGKELYTACPGSGARLNGAPIRVRQEMCLGQTLLLTETNPYSDRKKTRAMAVLAGLFLQVVDVRVTGSAALDLCYVAAGRAGVFATEKLTPWDWAAGQAILQEAGGTVTRWDGAVLDLQPGTILATNGLLHRESLNAIRALTTEE